MAGAIPRGDPPPPCPPPFGGRGGAIPRGDPPPPCPPPFRGRDARALPLQGGGLGGGRACGAGTCRGGGAALEKANSMPTARTEWSPQVMQRDPHRTCGSVQVSRLQIIVCIVPGRYGAQDDITQIVILSRRRGVCGEFALDEPAKNHRYVTQKRYPL